MEIVDIWGEEYIEIPKANVKYLGIAEVTMTIGFPAFASTPGKASTSSTGNISNFDTTKNLFITSGMNLNSGNSGGPVFLCKKYKVVGVAVAVAVLRGQITPDTAPIEGISYFIPINKSKNFAFEKLNRVHPV